MAEDCSRLEYWSEEIEKLEESNCKWGEKAHNALEIKNLCMCIGSDKELLNEEFIFLQDQLKKLLGCPKSVSVDLIDKSRLIATPPPPPPQIPEDCIEASQSTRARTRWRRRDGEAAGGGCWARGQDEH